ncbi:MAG: outer rane efflux protein [Candidatus Binatus sp.]|nr:outer rane efflux protein [Candidatus Binatus sp.]
MKYSCRLLIAVVAFVAISSASVAAAPLITLPDAIDRALLFAPSVEVAAAASDMSRAHVREQRAPLFPSITAGAEYYQAPGYDIVVTNRGLSTGMVTLDYTAWDWGRRQALVRAAEYVNQAAQLGVSASRAQIVFDTTIAYFDLLRALDAQRALQASLERLSRYVTTIDALRRSGRMTANDVLKVRSTRDATELALSTARSNVQRATMTLATTIGQPNMTDLEIAPLQGLPPKPSGDAARSPVVMAARQAIASASLQIKAARAERLPTFQVAFTTGFLGVDPRPTISHDFGGSYDGVVSMPIFDGGLISSHIDQAKAKERAAMAQARQAEYLLTRRITDASLRYDQAIDQLSILTHALPNAEDAFALSWTRFLGGGGATMLEVLDSYQQAEQLRLNGFEQQFAARSAAAEANLLLGRIQ